MFLRGPFVPLQTLFALRIHLFLLVLHLLRLRVLHSRSANRQMYYLFTRPFI